MKIAVASPPFPGSLNEGLLWLETAAKEAAAQQAEIICFPESYLPGSPGMPYPPEDRTKERLTAALDKIRAVAAGNRIAMVVPMDWHHAGGLLNVAFVISANGELLGYQSKNQLDPSEDHFWIPGNERRLFEVNGLKFGITICHEGFRYPESVRWAARNGAHVVFHPHCAGSNAEGPSPTEWGHKDTPYYEKAQMVRALENTIYFATSNYTFNYPESASALIAPD